MDAEKIYAERIGGNRFGKDTTVYKFAKIKSAKQEFSRANPDIDIIDLGVGEHDGIAPYAVRQELAKAVSNPEYRGYADNGILPFQQAAARYLNETTGTNLPTDESAAKYIIHSIGSKGALSVLPLAFINPGDAAVMTIPGYPVFGTHVKYLGGQVLQMPLEAGNKFLPNLKDLEKSITNFKQSSENGRVKAVCLNYPNNPTGANAPQYFWDEVASMAHKHNFAVIHDAAYSGLEFDGKKPTGILQAKGGMECGLGLYSLSKTFNMIGHRLGIVAGNPELIKAYANVKDNSDSGQSPFVQAGGVVALDNPRFVDEIRSKYKRRLGSLIEVLNDHGFDAKMPDGTFFLYTPSPTGTKSGEKFNSGEEASQYMLLNQGISVVPWDDVGNFIRFSATFNSGEQTKLLGDPSSDEKVFTELDKRLGRLGFTFT